MYEVHCIFCRRPHVSQFYDEIEESILRCRDAAPDWQKGRLSDFPEDTRPITVEAGAEALIAARAEENQSYLY